MKGVQKQPCWGGTHWEAATVASGEPGVTRRKSPETRHARRCRADLSLRPCRLSPRVGSLQSRDRRGRGCFHRHTRACEDGAQDRPAVGRGGDSGADEGSARSGQTRIPWAMGGPCASVQTASFCHVPLQDHIRADRTPEIRPSTFYLFVFFISVASLPRIFFPLVLERVEGRGRRERDREAGVDVRETQPSAASARTLHPAGACSPGTCLGLGPRSLRCAGQHPHH